LNRESETLSNSMKFFWSGVWCWHRAFLFFLLLLFLMHDNNLEEFNIMSRDILIIFGG